MMEVSTYENNFEND